LGPDQVSIWSVHNYLLAAFSPDGIFWNFTVKSITVGNYHSDQEIGFITDTGTTEILLPPPIFEGIIKEIGAQNAGAYYVVPCSKEFTIEFKIGEHTYQVSSKEATIQVTFKNNCSNAIFERSASINKYF
jgi:hypothetical protein